MKKLALLVLLLIFTMAACSSGTSPSSSPNPVTSPSASASPSAQPADSPAPDTSPAPSEVPDSPTAAPTISVDSGNVETGLEPGNRAPDFEITLTDGSKKSLSDFRGSKPVFINMWATWCGPCVSEMPGIQSLYSTYGDMVEFFLVNSGDSKDVIEDFIAETGYTFPIGLDETNAVSTKYELQFLPTTFIIDKNGIITQCFEGSQDEDAFKAEIEKVVGH